MNGTKRIRPSRANQVYLAASISAVLAGYAQADVDKLISLSLEELMTTPVLSTSLFEQTYAESSYPISVVTELDWNRLGARNLGDLLNHMPSTLAPHAYGQSRALVIRGYLSNASTQGTAVKIDGISINKLREGGGLMAADGFDLALVDSAELIRGPGSALHGNDAFQGTLSLNTLGFGQQQTRLIGEAGSSDFYAASLSQTFELDKHDFVFGGAYRELGALNQAYSYTDAGQTYHSDRGLERKNTNLLFKHRFTLDKASVQSSIAHYAYEGHELLGFGSVGGINLADKDFSHYSDELTLFNIKASVDLTPMQSLDAQLYGWWNEDTFSVDLTSVTFLPGIGVERIETRAETRRGARVVYKLSSDLKGNIALGYEYQRSLFDEYVLRNVNSEFGIDLVSTDRPEQGYIRELSSVFTDGRYYLSLDWVFDFGFRYDYYSDFSAQFNPRFALTHHIDDAQKIALSYATAFRAPNLLEIFGSELIAPNDNLEPETLASIDLKYEVLLVNSIASISLFYSEWEEGIGRTLISGDTTGVFAQYQNIGNNESWGLELSSRYHLDKLFIQSTASYIKSKNSETDEEFSAFPDLIFDLSVGYDFNAHWTAYINSRAMRRSKNSPDFSELDSDNIYLRNDVVIAWNAKEKISAQIMFRNIFDRKNSLPSLSYHEEGVADEGFSVNAKISYTF